MAVFRGENFILGDFSEENEKHNLFRVILRDEVGKNYFDGNFSRENHKEPFHGKIFQEKSKTIFLKAVFREKTRKNICGRFFTRK